MIDHHAASPDMELIVHGPSGRNKPETRLWLRMLSTTRLITNEIRRRLRSQFGATLPQFDLMAQLYREEAGLRLGELSRRTMVTNGNITGLVERLEADGLVKRTTHDQDRRVTVAKLTPAGIDRFLLMAAAHEEWLRELLQDAGDEAVQSLWVNIGYLKASVSAHLSGEEAE
ncbi:DNA-binding MarR family transcriptional regulator [Pseudorhizobium tarimense]|uniref:DNA-binding MarR family transcriptional regulator n=1 Tax=Pseudorhizobium tarimense TaxID=1079109 RepID=A0ABV2H8K0_9HYPH|nr:MarR family transcriptional regulator [Pseudorhizobium tarimense]MCJ8519977.1 MarR family transcriptional regulator [Pseudorhizobium tarimense]